jgi:polysaccharide deacetylase 2 family uncharacterized protein YibQ
MSRRPPGKKPAVKKPARSGRRKGGPRPNPKRQFVLVVAAVAALAVGYLLGERSLRAPPPASVQVPVALAVEDGSILPDPSVVPPREPLRPYEESLPEGIHTSVTLPMPPPPAPPLPAPPAVPVQSVERGDDLPLPPPEKPEKRLPSSPAPAPRVQPSGPAEPPPVLTVRREGGPLPAWKQYAVAVPDVRGRPMIAVVIDDLGVDRGRTAKVIGLKAPLTLSFLTYAQDLPRQTALGRRHGHELMLHVPMEPSSAGMDPGPNVLTTRLGEQEIARRLDWGLSRFEGFVGINNHMGSKFTGDARGMAVVMRELKRRGLVFLDSRTTGHTAGPEAALAAGVPFAERNVFLDNVDEVPEVRARLADLEAVAGRHGYAIGIGHPRDATIAALSDWIPRLGEKGLVLVPLTTIIERLQTPG